MRRFLLALAGTTAGLVTLLGFKSHGSPASGTAAAGSSSQGVGSASSAPQRGTAAGTRTATGAVASTPYGPMQVQVVLRGSTITAVRVLQRTDSGSRSDQIDAAALPHLTAEALATQSARIDAVSGASYTSAGYIRSLQSALDTASA
jgi:uncharacterized protein with FMN-binding domain